MRTMDTLQSTEIGEVISINKLFDLISEVMIQGFGEVNMKVTIRNNRVVTTYFTKTESFNIGGIGNTVQMEYPKK